MRDETDYENLSVFEQLKRGLEQAIASGQGELSLRTTVLPAPPPPTSRSKVAALRKRLGMSQSVFAATLNVSTKLVQSWEQGTRVPDRGELRLIQLLTIDPGLASRILHLRPSTRRVTRSRV